MGKTSIALTAADMSKRWGDNLRNAVPRITAGIDAVTESPTEKAAANAEAYAAGVQAAVASGKFQAGLRKVSLSDWKSVTKTKVTSNLSAGITAAMPKRQKFDAWLKPTLESNMATNNALPKRTIEDSINKMRQQVMYMHDHPYKTAG